MLFGSSPLIAALSWVVVITLGGKLLATLYLLTVGKKHRDRPGWGTALWWLTKITPVIAVPCAILIAWLEHMTDQVWLFAGMMVFVAIAVPMKVRQRRARIANCPSRGRQQSYGKAEAPPFP